VLIALGVALRVAFLVWSRGTLVDDAHITLRCAENLAAGRGLVCNPGDRTLVVTSPLYSLVVSGFVVAGAGGALQHLVAGLGIPLFALTAVFILRLSPELGRRAVTLAALIFAAHVSFADNATLGMETPMFVFGVAGSLLLMSRREWAWRSFVLGLLILVRPEGVIWALSVLLVIAWKRERPRARSAVPGLAVVLAWLGFSLACYGTAVPQRMLSKSGWVVPFVGRPAAARLLTAVAQLSLVEPLGRGAGPASGVALRILFTVVVLLFGVGAVTLWRRRSVMLVLPTFFVLYVAWCFAGKARLDFSWYGVPSGFAFALTASVGVAQCLGRLARGGEPRGVLRAATVAAGLALGVAGAVGWRSTRLPYYELLRTSYERAGEFVSEHSSPEARVLVDEVGLIGYSAERYVCDLDGLTSREFMRFRLSLGWWAPIGEIVHGYGPDWIVLSKDHASDLLRGRGREQFLADYQVAAELVSHVVFCRVGDPGAE